MLTSKPSLIICSTTVSGTGCLNSITLSRIGAAALQVKYLSSTLITRLGSVTILLWILIYSMNSSYVRVCSSNFSRVISLLLSPPHKLAGLRTRLVRLWQAWTFIDIFFRFIEYGHIRQVKTIIILYLFWFACKCQYAKFCVMFLSILPNRTLWSPQVCRIWKCII